MEQNNLIDVLKTLFKWKKQIFITCLIAGIGSVVVSLVLPVYYEATTVFFVASPDQANPELLFGESGRNVDFYGDENDIDRVLTIAESAELYDYLVAEFNLYAHYDIDSTHVKAPYYVGLALADHYDIKKTSKDAIVLTIEDEEKEQAAEMAQKARIRIDEIAKNLIRENLSKAISTFNADIQYKEGQLKILSDTLLSMRAKYGIFNVKSQTESLSNQLLESEAKLASTQSRLEVMKTLSGIRRDTIAMLGAKVKGMEGGVALLNSKMNTLNEGLGMVTVYEGQYQEASASLGEDKERLKRYQATFNSTIPALILVEEAQTPVIKSKPKRKLLVLGAVVVAFFFSLIAVLLLEAYKDVNWREVYKGG